MSVYDNSTTQDNNQSFIRKSTVDLTNLTNGTRIVTRILEELGVTPGEIHWLLGLGVHCEFRYPGEKGVSVTDAVLAMTKTCQRKSLNASKLYIKRSRQATKERQSTDDAVIVVTISRPRGQGQGSGRPYVYDPLFLKIVEEVVKLIPPGAPDRIEREIIMEAVQTFAGKKRRQLEEQRKKGEAPSAKMKRGVSSVMKSILGELALYKDNEAGLRAALGHWQFYLYEELTQLDPDLGVEIAELLTTRTLGILQDLTRIYGSDSTQKKT